uniref:Uncharacterized protein n=1 Tax=Timema bartmani TaxID=61472 RepID=A0A7R9ET89_9NEOP|nr:unnamed protein product [Timema bartmani]
MFQPYLQNITRSNVKTVQSSSGARAHLQAYPTVITHITTQLVLSMHWDKDAGNRTSTTTCQIVSIFYNISQFIMSKLSEQSLRMSVVDRLWKKSIEALEILLIHWEDALRVSHSSLMSSDRMNPRSGFWEVFHVFIGLLRVHCVRTGDRPKRVIIFTEEAGSLPELVWKPVASRPVHDVQFVKSVHNGLSVARDCGEEVIMATLSHYLSISQQVHLIAAAQELLQGNNSYDNVLFEGSVPYPRTLAHVGTETIPHHLAGRLLQLPQDGQQQRKRLGALRSARSTQLYITLPSILQLIRLPGEAGVVDTDRLETVDWLENCWNGNIYCNFTCQIKVSDADGSVETNDTVTVYEQSMQQIVIIIVVVVVIVVVVQQEISTTFSFVDDEVIDDYNMLYNISVDEKLDYVTKSIYSLRIVASTSSHRKMGVCVWRRARVRVKGAAVRGYWGHYLEPARPYIALKITFCFYLKADFSITLAQFPVAFLSEPDGTIAHQSAKPTNCPYKRHLHSIHHRDWLSGRTMKKILRARLATGIMSSTLDLARYTMLSKHTRNTKGVVNISGPYTTTSYIFMQSADISVTICKAMVEIKPKALRSIDVLPSELNKIDIRAYKGKLISGMGPQIPIVQALGRASREVATWWGEPLWRPGFERFKVGKYGAGLPRLYRSSIYISLKLSVTNTTWRMPTARPHFGSGAPRRARAIRFDQTHLANGHVTRSHTATKRDYANCREMYLSGLHSLYGCDTGSQFRGHEKQSAWKVYMEHTKLLSTLGTKKTPGEDNYYKVEQFTAMLYQ